MSVSRFQEFVSPVWLCPFFNTSKAHHGLSLYLSTEHPRIQTYYNSMMSFKSKPLPGCVPLPIPSTELQVLSEEAKYFACINGFFLQMNDNANLDAAVPGPFMLLPSPVPRNLYQKAVVNQRYINELYFKVSNDYDFLWKSLESTIAVDDFTAKQWAIYEEARKANKLKDIQLALIRADYQLDTSRGQELKLSQVEVNTISVAMVGISSQLRKVHNVVLQKLGRSRDLSRLVEHNGCTDFAKTLISAWKLFNNPEAVVVMLTHEDEVNVFDHKLLEQTIYELQPGLTFLRTTMTDMGKRATLTKNDTLLMNDKEVAVVYYRTGYMPEHFQTDYAWKAKLMAELSNAIVCPSVGWHLAGLKKVQQELNRPGVLETYISDPQVISEIRETFTGMYSLDQTPEGDAAAARGIAEPHKYVMKPQLEGGCNNLFDDELRDMLQNLSESEERSSYILMDRIRPAFARNYMIRNGKTSQLTLTNVSTEFGIFGTFISKGGEILKNDTAGYLMRTRGVHENESSVCGGIAGLDSPFLTD